MAMKILAAILMMIFGVIIDDDGVNAENYIDIEINLSMKNIIPTKTRKYLMR